MLAEQNVELSNKLYIMYIHCIYTYNLFNTLNNNSLLYKVMLYKLPMKTKDGFVHSLIIMFIYLGYNEFDRKSPYSQN